MMAYLQVGKEKSTIHVFDQLNQHRWSPEPNRHDVAQLREVHCNRAKCSTLTTLCINNFNCSVDFRAFSRYTAIKKYIIVFLFRVTEGSAKIVLLKCLTQYKFCSLYLTALPFSESSLIIWLPHVSWSMLRCIFATKGSQIKQKYRHVCARGGALFIQKLAFW